MARLSCCGQSKTLTQLALAVCIVRMCTSTVKANGAIIQLPLGGGDVLNSCQIYGTTSKTSIRGSKAKTFDRLLDVGLKHVTHRVLPVTQGASRPGECTKLVSTSRRAKIELGWSADRSNLKQMITDAWRLHQSGSYTQ